jgi:hypothetical protein
MRWQLVRDMEEAATIRCLANTMPISSILKCESVTRYIDTLCGYRQSRRVRIRSRLLRNPIALHALPKGVCEAGFERAFDTGF